MRRPTAPVPRRALVAALAIACVCAPLHAANLADATFLPLKAPDCILDPADAFFAQNGAPSEDRHPSLPWNHYYLVARYMGTGAVAAPASFDYGHVPDSYSWEAMRGRPLTGLTVPEPRSDFQRASRVDGDLDSSSAFQIHCFDAGSYINTWQFANQPINGGGPHAIFGFSFYDPPPPPVYDDDDATDLVLQASVEVPWLMSWPDRTAFAQFDPVGQVSMFAYFRSMTSGRTFGLLLAIFDNRAGAAGRYEPFVEHDGSTPFVSAPLGPEMRFATLSPYSRTFTGIPWSGLRFFRGHVTQDDFRRALAGVNAYCAEHRGARFCDDRGDGLAFGEEPRDYAITDFGLLHEVFRGGPAGHISMAIHASDVGAWRAKDPRVLTGP